MNNKRGIPLIIFSLAVLVLILGIIQVALFLGPQLDSIKQARAQGVEEQQITDYYRTQLAPQTLSHIINNLGFVLVLTSIGLISLTLPRTQGSISDNQGRLENLFDEVDNAKLGSQDIFEAELDNSSEGNPENDPEDNPEDKVN